jgi:glycosyltransferase involved in cell wall biosynthesis
MRVLIYAIDFAPKIGGEETFLLLLGQALADRMRRRTAETASREGNRAKADRDKWSLITSSARVLHGFLTGHALRAALAGVAALVMPSICEETCGNAAIEQMTKGRLVIASDIGGLGEVVGDTGASS